MNQKRFFRAYISPVFDISIKLVLPVCWGLGLLLGITYGFAADPSYFLLMRSVASDRMSIVGLLGVLYFPLLVSAFAVYFKRPQWLLLICFFKAFLFASCGSALLISFGSASWLVRLLLQFSDCCTVPLLYWFCMRSITGYSLNTRLDFWICSMCFAVVGIFDYCVISPFLVKLINN